MFNAACLESSINAVPFCAPGRRICNLVFTGCFNAAEPVLTIQADTLCQMCEFSEGFCAFLWFNQGKGAFAWIIYGISH